MEKEKAIVESLERDGWNRQFIATEPRLSEAVELYEGMGLDIRLEPLPPVEEASNNTPCDLDGECRECYKGSEDKYKIIFTRPKKDNT